MFAPLLVASPLSLPCLMLHFAPCFAFRDESGTMYQGIQDCHNIRYLNLDADVPQRRYRG